MPFLYAAHCLHDLKRWREAVVAYSRVDQKALLEQRPLWRTIKLREQYAYCLLHVGRRDESLQAFRSVIEDWKHAPVDELAGINLDELVEVATTTFRAELYEAVKSLVVRFDWQNIDKERLEST